MTTEELKVKISVDTSEVNTKVQEAKRKLGGLGDEMDKSTGATKNTTAAMVELRDSMERIRNLQFADILMDNMDKVVEHISAAKDSFRDFSGYLSEAKDYLNPKNMFDFSNIGKDSPLKDKLQWLKEGFQEAGADIKKGFAAAGNGAKSFGSALGALIPKTMLVAGAILAAIASIVAAIKNAINVAKQMKQIVSEAKNIGLDVRSYQEWSYVLESVGVGADKLSDFLKTLADEQNAVREGSEDIIAAFNKLGLSADKVSNMSQGELFKETVARLQNVENEVERTAIAYKIFGEDAANLTSLVAMNNQQLAQLTNNFYMLGGVASDSLIEKSNTLQYSIQNMSTAWQGLKNTLGEAVMPAITAIVNALTKAIAVVNMFIRAVFGFDIISGSSNKSVERASGSIGGYTSSVGAATAAVEKLRRTTMGFDELNIVSAPTSGGGSGGGGGGGISGGGFDTGLGDMETVFDQLDLEGIAEKIEKFKEHIRLLTPVIMTAIGLIGCIACLITGNFIGAAIFGAMAGLGIAIGIESGAWEDIGKKIKTWWETKIVAWFNDKVKPVFTKEFWSKKWEKIKEGFKDGWDKLGKLIFGDEGWGKLTSWFDEKVKPVFTKEFWKEKFDNIKQGAQEKLQEVKDKVNEKWTEVKNWYNTNVAPKFTKEYWKTKFDNLKQGANDKLQETKTKLNEKWTEIKNWFSTNVGKYFTKEYWTNKFDSVRQGAVTLKDKITTTFTNVGGKIGEAVSGAVKGAINGIFSTIESKVNSFINMINNAIGVINKIPGVNIKTLSRVYIPRLAEGGITTGSILANIGENGREAVLPLEHNTSWMDTLADRIASRSAAPSKIVLMVDGRELGWASIHGINGITKQTGGLQLQLV
jgi:hypothetical protein